MCIKNPILAILLTLSLGMQAQQGEYQIIKLGDLEELFSKQDDTVRVFNFWATWCVPCVKELPNFETFNQEIKGTSQLLYLVSLDDLNRSQSKLSNFLKKKNVMSKVMVLDENNPNFYIDRIEPSWTGSIPATLVIGNQTRGFAEREFHSASDIQNWINSIIKK
ncbi:MAG: TlpA family protein disulfide reductase [Saprospiraceae bacterium]|nr:TlpA family protein disulfide reductase [Candidatus Vicinibacter proximus]MBL7822596.1 TlpA family protein disulfide reductase [Saprospiraceae bacterium]MCC6842354.1 TlpA family protein disulfide reductase [Saprospiraceae bacterium]HRG33921.1 TlpA disulfide reductase family protein [Saprospiraceae bacterium]